jgi:hypothetical protein
MDRQRIGKKKPAAVMRHKKGMSVNDAGRMFLCHAIVAISSESWLTAIGL